MRFKEQNWRTLPAPASGLSRTADDTCRGLYCQVTPTGVASWIFRGTLQRGAKAVIVTLGRCDAMSPSAARDAVDKLRRAPAPVIQSEAPVIQSVVPEPVPAPAMTFAKMAEDFMARYPHKSGNEIRNKKNNLKRLVARFGETPISDITPRIVVTFLDSIVAEGHSATANAVHRTLSRVYKWGQLRYDGIAPNPCNGIDYLSLAPRQERLWADDLKKLGEAIQGSEHLYKWGVCIPLLCGGRIGSLEQIEQGRWDPEKRRVEFFGAEGVKALDYLYISPEAKWCWDQLPRISGPLIREAWEAIRVSAAFERVIRRHDFRRTYKSYGSDIGEQHIQLELLMGHSLGRIADTYHVQDWRVLQSVNDRVSSSLWAAMGFAPLASEREIFHLSSD